GYEIDAGRLLFRNTAWEDEDQYWGELTLSRPLVFQHIGVKGTPQRPVAFLPGRRPTPSARADPADETGFVEMVPKGYDWLEVLTDAGGRLEREAREQPLRFRLDLSPGSERQP